MSVNLTGLPQVLEDGVQNGVAVRHSIPTACRESANRTGVVSGTWTTSFYGYDGGGSVRQLTDSTGKVTDEYEYDAFGNSFTKSGTTPNNYLYRGEQFDADLGLYYLRARYYNPNTGRFLSRDPNAGYLDKPASLHKYLYANGDPVNGLDPTGREAMFETGIRLAKAAAKTALITSLARTTMFLMTCAATSLDELIHKYAGTADGIPPDWDAMCWGLGVVGVVQSAMAFAAAAAL